jgi:hypothetical protein
MLQAEITRYVTNHPPRHSRMLLAGIQSNSKKDILRNRYAALDFRFAETTNKASACRGVEVSA